MRNQTKSGVPCIAASKRLLLIACNPNFRRTLERILCRCGYTVDGAASGEEALARVESTAYDAIISEVMLPGSVCGLTVLDRVRRHHPNLPIILLTEAETARMRLALEQCAGVKCLTMPVDVDQLKQLIATSTRPAGPSLA
ncbi:MAG TPA: response regulator [Candidatus Kryptonia bacterium]|nr:response regulator [Candidatus Kryptonia bacterium]